MSGQSQSHKNDELSTFKIWSLEADTCPGSDRDVGQGVFVTMTTMRKRPGTPAAQSDNVI